MLEWEGMRIQSVQGHVREAAPVDDEMVGFVEAGDQLIGLEFGLAHFAFFSQHLNNTTNG